MAEHWTVKADGTLPVICHGMYKILVFYNGLYYETNMRWTWKLKFADQLIKDIFITEGNYQSTAKLNSTYSNWASCSQHSRILIHKQNCPPW